LVVLSGAVVVLSSARRSEPEPAVTTGPTTAAATVAAPPAAASATGSARWSAAPTDADDASCDIPDQGPGLYPADFTKLPVGRMVVPTPAPTASYDLLLHLHGGEPARRIIAPLMRPDLVMVAVDAGVGSQVYASALAGPEPLKQVLAAVDEVLAPAQLQYLIVSSWSAGYGGVREILTHHPTVPNALVLLDSVHASYQPDGKTLVEEGLKPFASFASRAIADEAVMVLTHSEIRPPGYASTSEVAAWLLGQVDGRRRYAGLLHAQGVEFKTRFDDGQLHVRGYTGRGKAAHCAQLMLLADILQQDIFPALGPR